jgi:hypothetical protein
VFNSRRGPQPLFFPILLETGDADSGEELGRCGDRHWRGEKGGGEVQGRRTRRCKRRGRETVSRHSFFFSFTIFSAAPNCSFSYRAERRVK